MRLLRFFGIQRAQWGTVYRYERSGTLHGLMRVRGFTQDDAHIFCTKGQVYGEILRLLDFVERVLRKSGFHMYKAYFLQGIQVNQRNTWTQKENGSRHKMFWRKLLKKRKLSTAKCREKLCFMDQKLM